MAGGLMGLGAGLSAYTQERQKLKEQKYQDQLQQQYLALQNKNADLTAQQVQSGLDTDATTRAVNEQKLAEAKRQAAQDAKDQAGMASVRYPADWGAVDPVTKKPKYYDERKLAYLQVRYDYAVQQNNDPLQKSTLALMNSIGGHAAGLANAAFTRGAKTDVAYSQVDLNHARAMAERDLPARARQIAAGHDKAAWDRATAQITSHQLIAQYQGQTRTYVAQLAGAYMLTGKTMDEAARAAVAELNNKTRVYLQQTRPTNADYVPPADAQGAVDPTQNGAQGGVSLGDVTKLVEALRGSGPPAFPSGAGGGNGAQPPAVVPPKPAVVPPGPSQDARIQGIIAKGKQLITGGSTRQQIEQQLATAKPPLTPGQIKSVLKALYPGVAAPSPRPAVPTPAAGAAPRGGSQAAVPFP